MRGIAAMSDSVFPVGDGGSLAEMTGAACAGQNARARPRMGGAGIACRDRGRAGVAPPPGRWVKMADMILPCAAW